MAPALSGSPAIQAAPGASSSTPTMPTIRQPISTMQLLRAWGRMLRGATPLLSIEITRECPLHCPGCYAYGAEHLGGGVTLRQLNELRGDALVRGVIELVDHHK